MKHLREIKFRAWNGAEMVYDITVGRFGAFYVNPGAKKDGLDEKDGASLTQLNTKYPDTTPVMQYTGLKDKNGKEIYEGDLVGLNEPDNAWQVDFYTPKAAYVIWSETPYNNFVLTEAFFRRNKVEVIGNIWEHPELLEKPK